MRLSDLRDKRLVTEAGEKLGRVHEVHCDKGKIVALMCGAGSWIERWTAKKKGRRIPWECVRKVGPGEIVVIPDPPQRKPAKRASAARSRKGTPQPSGQRSKR